VGKKRPARLAVDRGGWLLRKRVRRRREGNRQVVPWSLWQEFQRIVSAELFLAARWMAE
jgi:hypothetical protein